MKRIVASELSKNILVIVCTGIILFIMNRYTGMYCDDYSYSFSFATGERITEIKQIISSIMEHYKTVNGRFYTHVLAQVFLLLDKSLFNFINTAAFLGLGILIAFYKSASIKNIKFYELAFIYSMLIIVTPKFSQSFLWIDGSANYLYGILTLLLFIIPYRKDIVFNHAVSRVLFCVVMFSGGIIAGNTNENTSIASIICICSLIIINKMSHNRTPSYFYAGLIGNVIGFCSLIISPGQLSRLESAGGFYSMITGIIRRFVFVTLSAGEYMGLLIIIATIVAVIMALNYINNRQEENVLTVHKYRFIDFAFEMKYELSFSICFIVSVYSLILSPSSVDRVFTGPICILLVCVMIFAGRIFKQEGSNNIEMTVKIGVIAIVFVALCMTGNGIMDLRICNRDYTNRECMILEQKEQGARHISTYAIESDSRFCTYRYSGDLGYYKNDWPNTDIARYYGVESIVRDDSKTPVH